jgi:NAD(P)-dependent dehydrogenase (short-subunit alcohol dehydrogenase family)
MFLRNVDVLCYIPEDSKYFSQSSPFEPQIQVESTSLLLFQELSGNVKTAPGKLYAVKCDVTKEADVKEAFKWIKSNLGGVDILVNNAGGDSSNTLTGEL